MVFHYYLFYCSYSFTTHTEIGVTTTVTSLRPSLAERGRGRGGLHRMYFYSYTPGADACFGRAGAFAKQSGYAR